VLTDICEDALTEPAFLKSIAASFSGFFDVCSTPGQVDLSIDAAQRVAEFRLTW
jgi:hypothetical protein